jgi:RIO kinase 1
MSSRPSKRKKPSRDDFVLKEERKLESEVFDRNTLRILAKMVKKGVFSTLDFPINTGKEANVFRATTPDGIFLAVKIYKMETAPFFRKIEYLEGDPRFGNIKRNDRSIVLAFARKEFKNLKICEEAGVHVPRPIYLDKNVLVMSFIGENGLPYVSMNLSQDANENDLDSLLTDIRKMYKAGLVHADISEYNVLMSDPPTLIDLGQGVVLSHPRAKEFLERDVRNILAFFGKLGIKRDLAKMLEWIRK